MKQIKKISALVLALVLVLSLSVSAFAVTLTDGEAGGSSSFAKDNPVSQGKVVELQKELTAYNTSEATINAPTISYTYSIAGAAATDLFDITDAKTDHNNDTAVKVTAKAGDPTRVSMTGQGQANGTATIAWAPTETLDAAADGKANYKTLSIDFSNVVFDATGVYRYVITETASAYAASGVTETTATVNPHVRYLDVYVRPAPTGFTDGTKAADWDIYGFVCFVKSKEITDADDTAVAGALKTNGFVAGSNNGTNYKADSYYTYNVTVSKTVTGDSFAKATHAFPFTVIFTNATVTNAVDISSKTTGTVGGYADPAAGAPSSAKGILNLKDSSSVKYIGIPCGTTVEVYETNDVAGVTYQVTTTVDGTTSTTDDTVDVAVISGTTPTTAAAQAAQKPNYESTKATFTPTVNTADEVDHTIAVDNALQLISPTGVVLRVAPFIVMLVAGIVILLVTRRYRRREEA